MTAARLPKDAVHNIVADLLPLAKPIGDLVPLPGNPHSGDVEAVARSYSKFGQRKPIVCKADGTVTAGNHQLLAAMSLGWTHLAAVKVDDTDEMAKAFALADNKTGSLGTDDDTLVAAFLADIREEDELLSATGYADDEIANLLAGFDDPGGLPPESNHGGNGLGTPVISYTIVFDDEAQQKRWHALCRRLRIEQPNAETLAERLDAWLDAAGVTADA